MLSTLLKMCHVAALAVIYWQVSPCLQCMPVHACGRFHNHWTVLLFLKFWHIFNPFLPIFNVALLYAILSYSVEILNLNILCFVQVILCLDILLSCWVFWRRCYLLFCEENWHVSVTIGTVWAISILTLFVVYTSILMKLSIILYIVLMGYRSPLQNERNRVPHGEVMTCVFRILLQLK